MAYTPTTWVNNSAPPINATNLNNIEDGIVAAHDAIDAINAVDVNIQEIDAKTGTTYTPVATDAGKLITLSNTGSITVTMPQDSAVTLPVGVRIDFLVINTGMATFVAGSGATVNATPSAVTRARYSAVTAIKRAANTWLLVGDLATP